MVTGASSVRECEDDVLVLRIGPLFTLRPVYAGTTCEPVWEEDFTGPLDGTVWNVVEGDGCAEGICG